MRIAAAGGTTDQELERRLFVNGGVRAGARPLRGAHSGGGCTGTGSMRRDRPRRIADNPKWPLVRTIGRGAAAHARTHATDDACRIIVDRCSSGRRHHIRTKRLEPARLRRRSEP